jgi:hypothetical protein
MAESIGWTGVGLAARRGRQEMAVHWARGADLLPGQAGDQHAVVAPAGTAEPPGAWAQGAALGQCR